jgi:general secretion pathway protein D
MRNRKQTSIPDFLCQKAFFHKPHKRYFFQNFIFRKCFLFLGLPFFLYFNFLIPIYLHAQGEKISGKETIPLASKIIKVEAIADQNGVKVLIEGNGELRQKSFMIDNNRLVVDLLGTSSQLESHILPGAEPVLKKIRIGEHVSPNKVRVVLDLSESVPFKVIEKGKIISVFLAPESFSEGPSFPSSTLLKTSQDRVKEQVLSSEGIEKVPFGKATIVKETMGADNTKQKTESLNQEGMKKGEPILVASQIPKVENSQTPNGSGETPGKEFGKKVPVLAKPSSDKDPKLITMDFNNVDLPVLVKFISELTGKNFMIDEKVRGRVTIFSPKKLNPEEAYGVFLSVLDLKGLAALPVGEVIQIVPKNQLPETKDINVYFLENSNAEDMAKLLAGLVARSGGTARAQAVSKATGDDSTGIEGPVQILPDKSTNALIITSSPEDFERIKKVIQQLDVRRRQVYVEAVILEIGLDTLREIGVEAQVPIKTDSNNELSGVLQPAGGTNFGGISTLATQGPVGLTGLAVGIIKGTFEFQGNKFLNIGALLRALQSDSDVNILSTPQLLTSDNQKAEIVVGQNIPITTGQSQTTGGNTVTAIERMDVGITLRLVPQIMENNLVKLDVFQEISTVTDTPQSVQDLFVGPTTNKRSTNTTVIVEDKQTAVLGGLIRDDLIKSERKVPFLGDIPILGWLFKFQSKRVEKRNLLIFLTPYIVRNGGELDLVTARKTQEMAEFLQENQVEIRKRRLEFLEKGIHPPGNPEVIR